MLFWENVVQGVSNARKRSKERTCSAHLQVFTRFGGSIFLLDLFVLLGGDSNFKPDVLWLRRVSPILHAPCCTCGCMRHQSFHSGYLAQVLLSQHVFFCLWGCGRICWTFSQEPNFVPMQPVTNWGLILVWTTLSTSLVCSFRCTTSSLKPSDPSVGWGNQTWRYRLWRGREDLRQQATTYFHQAARGSLRSWRGGSWMLGFLGESRIYRCISGIIR